MISTFAPSAALAPYVLSVLVFDAGRVEQEAPLRWLVDPDTSAVACFLYGNGVHARHAGGAAEGRRSGVSGFQSKRFVVEGAGHQAGVIVRMRASAAGCFIGGAARDLVDRRVDYRELVAASRIESLEDELYGASDAARRAQLVDRFLVSQLRPDREDVLVRSTAQVIVENGGAISIATLAQRVHLSTSALERRFTSAVGVTPKQYARVVRLQRAFAHFRSSGSWADTAAATGFFDQSHLARECRAMIGKPPGAYWLESGTQTEPVRHSLA